MEQVLEGALSWVDNHLGYFDPFKNGELTGFCEIPMAELAILVLCAIRYSKRVGSKEIARCLDLLEVTYHRPEYEHRPFRAPETLVSHAIVAATLTQAGKLCSSRYEASFERLVRASTLTAPSLAPHRLMELRHALDLAGVRHELPSYRTLYLNTLAAYRVNPILLRKPEAYVITHVLFYAADLGRRRPLGLNSHDIERLATLVDQLLGMHIIAQNWDLAGELILSLRCLRRSSAFVRLGWNCIAGAQHSDGAVPGPRAPQVVERADNAMDPDSVVAACYHTTVVCAIAGLVSMQSAAL